MKQLEALFEYKARGIAGWGLFVRDFACASDALTGQKVISHALIRSLATRLRTTKQSLAAQPDMHSAQQ
jgi:hypothetical protein